MNARAAVLGGLLATLALVGCARQASPTGAASDDGPRAVFKAFVVATEEEDFKTFVACHSPEMQKHLAVDCLGVALQARALSKNDEKLAEDIKPILAVLNKYGLSEEVTKKARPAASPDTAVPTRPEMLKLLENKDAAAFAVDFIVAAQKTKEYKQDAPQVRPRLTDLKIDGDKAEGNMVVAPADGKKQPIAFVKVGDSWKIALPSSRKKN